MFNFLNKKTSTLITIMLNSNEICQIRKAEIPVEKLISAKLPSNNSELIFLDQGGSRYIHALTYEKGWIHLSVRVHQDLGCQIDCIISENEEFDEKGFVKGELDGIRFQPFFISGAKFDNHDLKGKGLFERGFHFPGTITRGNVSLSYICDNCGKSFRITSFHSGFGNVEYFYSESGLQTLIVSSGVDSPPFVKGKLDYEKLAVLEAQLPLSKDGTNYRYKNSFRCLHCGSAYIDFERFPEQREIEYYGNYFYGDSPIWYKSK